MLELFGEPENFEYYSYATLKDEKPQSPCDSFVIYL